MSKPTTKRAAAVKTANDTVLTKAAAVNIDAALAGLTQAQTKISRTLAEIQEELITKHAELAAVDEAITLKKEEMAQLHGLDSVLLSMDEARVRQQEELVQAQTQRQALTAQYEQLKRDTEQARQREEDEYRYARDQARKVDSDKWLFDKAARITDEDIRRAAVERSITEREEYIAKREIELALKSTEVDGKLDNLKKELERNHAIELASVKRALEHTAQMTAVEHKSQVTALSKDVAHRDGLLAAKEAEIQTLRVQLAEAIAAQTTLAKATVEAAGNKTAQAEALSLMTNIGGGGNGKPIRG